MFLALAFTASRQQLGPAAKIIVWLPALPRALEFGAPGFLTQANELQPDGRRYFLAEDPATHVLVTVLLEAPKNQVAPDECNPSLLDKLKRNSSRSASPLKGVARRQPGEMDIVEFTMAEVDGMPAEQGNIFGCIAKEDASIEAHISRMRFKSTGQPAFDSSLDSRPSAPGSRSSRPTPAGNNLKW